MKALVTVWITFTLLLGPVWTVFAGDNDSDEKTTSTQEDQETTSDQTDAEAAAKLKERLKDVFGGAEVEIHGSEQDIIREAEMEKSWRQNEKENQDLANDSDLPTEKTDLDKATADMHKALTTVRRILAEENPDSVIKIGNGDDAEMDEDAVMEAVKAKLKEMLGNDVELGNIIINSAPIENDVFAVEAQLKSLEAQLADHPEDNDMKTAIQQLRHSVDEVKRLEEKQAKADMNKALENVRRILKEENPDAVIKIGTDENGEIDEDILKEELKAKLEEMLGSDTVELGEITFGPVKIRNNVQAIEAQLKSLEAQLVDQQGSENFTNAVQELRRTVDAVKRYAEANKESAGDEK